MRSSIHVYRQTNGKSLVKRFFELKVGEMFTPVNDEYSLKIGMVIPFGKFDYALTYGNCIDLLHGKPDYIPPDKQVYVINSCYLGEEK